VFSGATDGMLESQADRPTSNPEINRALPSKEKDGNGKMWRMIWLPLMMVPVWALL
jgi:hypothetical protein